MTDSPLIVVFAYNRSSHLERCLASLDACVGAEEYSVRIYCDGPRSVREEEDCSLVRRVAGSRRNFRSTSVIARESNYGLSRSMIEGVGESLLEYDRVIVVEDDLVVSSQFLEYMKRGLQIYEDDDRVASIHGYVYPVPSLLPDSFFLRGADCWGWGTWRRAWERFVSDGSSLLEQLREAGLEERFDLDGAMGYTRMLQDQIEGRNDSWAIRWHASAFLAGMFTLYPGRSLVRNTGFDGTGTHSGRSGCDWNASWTDLRLPERIRIEENAAARAIIAAWLRKRRSPARRIARWLGGLSSPYAGFFRKTAGGH